MCFEPFQSGDVEVVRGLVEQQQVRTAGERAPERGAGQLPSREGLQLTIEHRVVCESKAVQRGQSTLAPRVTPGVLERRLGVGVCRQRGLLVITVGHFLFEPLQLDFQATSSGAPERM